MALSNRFEAPHAKSRSTLIGITLLFFVSLINYLDRQVLSVLLPAIKGDLRLTDAQLGFMAGTAFSLFYAAMGIPLGRLADRRSPRRVIAGALAFWSAMTVACGLAQGFGQLVVARVLVGVGEGGATPAANALIAALVPPDKRARALSLFSLGVPAALFVGFWGGGQLTQALGWRITLVIFGLPGILLAALVLGAMPEPGPPSAPGVPLNTVLRTILSRPSFIHLCLGSALFTLVWQGMIAWLPSYFTRTYGLPLSEVGSKLALVLAGSQALGLLAGGLGADLMALRGARRPLWICAAASFIPIPLYALIFAGGAPDLAFIMLFPAFAIGLLQGVPALSSVHAVTAPNTRGVAVATYLVIVNVISGFGALLIGLISDHLSRTLGASSLGIAILSVALPFSVWSALHFWVASRRIETDVSSVFAVSPGGATG